MTEPEDEEEVHTSRPTRTLIFVGFASLLVLLIGLWATGFLGDDSERPEGAFVNDKGTFFSTHAAPDEALAWMGSEDLIFNQPLPDETPVVSNSDTIAAYIDEIIRGQRLFDYASGFEEDANAPNLILVDSDREDFTEVTFRPQNCGADTWWNWSATEFDPYINGAYADIGQSGVPVPADLKMSADDEDFQLVVYDWRRDILIELWQAKPTNLTGRPGIEVCWGGITKDFAAAGTGIFPFPMGVSASGATAPGLTITLEDVRRGEIRHAIGVSADIAIDNADRSDHSYPANRTDGNCSDDRAVSESYVQKVTESMDGERNCLFEGQYLRLPKDFDLDSVEHPYARMVAKAARDYGLVLQDVAGCFCFQAESSNGVIENGLSSQNLWDQAYNGTPEWEVLAQIDWTQLEILPKDWNKPTSFQIPCAVPPNKTPKTNPMVDDPRCQVASDPYHSG